MSVASSKSERALDYLHGRQGITHIHGEAMFGDSAKLKHNFVSAGVIAHELEVLHRTLSHSSLLHTKTNILLIIIYISVYKIKHLSKRTLFSIKEHLPSHTDRGHREGGRAPRDIG